MSPIYLTENFLVGVLLDRVNQLQTCYGVRDGTVQVEASATCEAFATKTERAVDSLTRGWNAVVTLCLFSSLNIATQHQGCTQIYG